MRVVILILLILALSLDVKAIAVASDYLDGNILEVTDANSKIYNINLQNPESYEVKYKIDYSDKYMKAIDFKEEYILQPKSSATVKFNVTAPKYRKNSNLFDMSYTVHQLTTQPGSGIPFLTNINKNFRLKVIKDPDKFYIDDYYKYIPHIVVILAVVFFILRRELTKKRSGKNNPFKNRKIIKRKR